MSFSADWLALRADADARARDPALVAALAARFGGGAPQVLDLGAGTGATVAALAAALPGARWRLADNDPALLAVAQTRAAGLGAAAEALPLDLSGDFSAAFDPAPALVTASAFFDLAGAAAIDRLADAATAAGAAVYATLTYDGREDWSPPHPADGATHAAFLADMRRDKGLGPALGADAAAALETALRARGYRVRTARSDWRLSPPRDGALIAALAQGKADATGAPDDWRAARMAAQAVTVGHVDLLATLD